MFLKRAGEVELARKYSRHSGSQEPEAVTMAEVAIDAILQCSGHDRREEMEYACLLRSDTPECSQSM